MTAPEMLQKRLFYGKLLAQIPRMRYAAAGTVISYEYKVLYQLTVYDVLYQLTVYDAGWKRDDSRRAPLDVHLRKDDERMRLLST